MLLEVIKDIGIVFLVVMGIFDCIDDVNVEGLDFLIIIKMSLVSILCFGDDFYFS